MTTPESPYRRPALRRPADRNLFLALCGWACVLLSVVGAAVALVGASLVRDGGGDDARALALAGLAMLAGGAGGGVLLDGGRR